ncbi:MAG: arabinose isomerase [Oscillospiraceae bacterium]|nr:arabinose isomerase [Oscillospiraceae bacterium]
MEMNRKPRLGVLALMLEAYEPLFPGITAQQTAYVQEVLASLQDTADFTFPKIALNRSDIEKLTAAYNAADLDGILILLCSYSPGQYLIRAMQRNHLPLALALVQPDETVGDDFEELELTVNQGIHGSQDNANALLRAGIPCAFFAGSRFGGELSKFVSDFGAAAKTVRALQKMKIGIIGKLPGMGDVITDDMAVYKKIGPEFVYDSIGTVTKFCDTVTPEEVAQRVAAEREIFDVDPQMPDERHAEAVRMYIGIRRYLEANGYSGYTIHFDEFGADGRYTQLPLLAASSLMADGYGYAAEGDATTAMLMAAMVQLWGEANFSEMYMMDLKREAILLCHAGEGNYATARKDRKPFLMDRVFNEGGLSNPPTPIFAPEPGPACVMSLVHTGGDHFRLVFSKGQILDKCDLRKCDMPYMFFRPDSGVRQCVKSWLEQGGTHHETVVLGDCSDRVRLLCRLIGIEFVSV